MTLEIKRKSLLGEVLLNWWSGLDDNRANRAVLRRANDISAVEFSQPFQRLYRRLEQTKQLSEISPWQQHRLAAAIGLLAHVKEDHPGQSVPECFSRREEGGERAPVSELRFIRLLESPDAEALFAGVRRTLPLVDKKIDVLALANDIVNWGDEVKRRWAYGYQWQPDNASA